MTRQFDEYEKAALKKFRGDVSRALCSIIGTLRNRHPEMSTDTIVDWCLHLSGEIGRYARDMGDERVKTTVRCLSTGPSYAEIKERNRVCVLGHPGCKSGHGVYPDRE